MSINVGVKELLEAGVHFGHQTRRWNPKMKRFIFAERNGVHVIDLNQTQTQLETACNFLAKVAGKGGKILFVGTKKQAQEAIKEAAEITGMPYVTERWLGGTLTNLKTIRRSIAKMTNIEKMDADGTIAQYVKKEQGALRREAEKMAKNMGGIRNMTEQPDAMFVIDIKREHNAVAEARRLRIPLIAMVDTNCDPDLVDFPIAANDDAIRSIRVVLGAIVQSVGEARAAFDARYNKKGEEAAPAPEAAPAAPAPAAEPAAPAATAEDVAALAQSVQEQ
ncbi:MAG: 30S ribosomal protein S2 [Verrucomicrobia bacterium]|nr:30S ribosomal protein S2 [Verrucomicrobiota bacterium]MBR5605514.1 30S ribosomal protein S2 [Verrucomicrobiota bacterium]MBR5691131.1 30S ribosomal protein S2 [Verrucomicrobiota bacterium]MBR5737604.1 30S ribosomal protein S2 [Verrucomicrobiota bacterium]MBR5978629.1 30S ribosomal protein S2 [Verrucomicrobiota bacterium]